jgi:hypothetical protein
MNFPTIRLAFLSAALALTPFAMFAQPAPAVSPAGGPVGPRLTFSETEYQFGKIPAGTKVKHAFIFTNTGDQALVISNVAPGCHCTTVGDWSQAHQIQPGKTGEIPIQFDSGAFRGTVHKTILVTSNDKLAPRQTILLTGTIWRAFEISPPMARIDVPPDATTNATTIVKITSQSDEPVTLSDPISGTERFKAKLISPNPGKIFDMEVEAVPPFAPGPTVGTITVKTSLASTPELQVTVIAATQPAVSVSPLQIPLPPRLVHGMTNIIRVIANGHKPIVVNEAKVTDSRVHLELKETNPGREFQMIVVFPAEYQITPGTQVVVSAKTDNPSYPTVTVPVIQFPPQRSMAPPIFRPKPLTQNPPPQPVIHP